MNLIPRLVLALACASTAPLASTQTSTQPAVSSAPQRPAHLRPVMRPPASALPPRAALLSTSEAAAVRGTPPPLRLLPDFPLTDRDGHTVSSLAAGKSLLAARTPLTPNIASAATPPTQPPPFSSTSPSTHWLLLYRIQTCLPCDRLMNHLAGTPSPDFQRGTPYVVLVSIRSANGLETVRAAHPSFSSAVWLADTTQQAFAALRPRGTPMLYAMDGNRIAFSIPGNLSNPALVNTMADNWIKTSTNSAATAK